MCSRWHVVWGRVVVVGRGRGDWGWARSEDLRTGYVASYARGEGEEMVSCDSREIRVIFDVP